MAEKSIISEPTSLDPMFYIPEGVVELVYTEEGAGVSDDVETEVSDDFVDDEYVTEDDTDYSESPATPDILGLAEPQTLRRAADGTYVVDIVLDVEDLGPDIEYEFKVTTI